jgi:hypothetical protein
MVHPARERLFSELFGLDAAVWIKSFRLSSVVRLATPRPETIRNIAGKSGIAVGFLVAIAVFAQPSWADEGGVSFWLPGSYGSLAATPQAAGWSWASVYYHTSLSAGGDVSAAREVTIGRFSPTIMVNLNANLTAHADLALFGPTYVFASPVLGGQLAVGMTGIYGGNNTGLNGTLTAAVGGLSITRSGAIEDSRADFGDLYPKASLKWNVGVHNFMTYVTGDIPTGAYDPTRLSNLGIGHGAFDGGGGYTYFDPKSGHEFSVVTGLTYNFKNPSTDYQNGVDWHVDWGLSQFLSKQVHIGVVGYLYDQLTADSGASPFLGENLSRVAGIGPQIGYLFPVGDMQGYLNLKAYWEFDADRRPDGWNVWLTFAISPATPGAPPPKAAMYTK